MAEKKELLFDQFPPVSTEEWKAKVEADLKGAPFDKKLVWRTNEGFNLQPMYRAEDIESLHTTDSLPGEYPFIRGIKTDNDWLSRQEIIADTPEKANALALEVLAKGINSLGFKVKDGAELPVILNGIDLAKIEINIKCCPKKALAVTKALAEFIKASGCADSFRGSVDFNPFKKALKHGQPFSGDIAQMGVEMVEAAKDVPGLKVLAVDSVMLSDAGAYIFQELGYALAWGAEWLTLLTDKGVSAPVVASNIKFNMGVSSNYFMELAKFRAARMLWAQIVKQYDGTTDNDCKQHVHATTSRFNQTIYDAHVNLLRSQTECMSAALAGVDSITVTPFDTPYKTPDAFSERIARNQQFLLKEESHLDKVVDPAGGSYYIENLTQSIAAEAWKLFLEIEEKGGYTEAYKAGFIAERIKASAAAKDKNIATRRQILLGANQYPNFTEVAGKEITAESVTRKQAEGNVLVPYRGAMAFEEMRLHVDRSGKEPKAFMLTCGNLGMARARSQFSCNFFACAGIKVIDNTYFKSIEEGVKAALESKAQIVVVCASDDDYAEAAPKIKELLGGKAILVVAGAPACAPELEAQGITNFINVKSNVLETLKFYLKEMEI